MAGGGYPRIQRHFLLVSARVRPSGRGRPAPDGRPPSRGSRGSAGYRRPEPSRPDQSHHFPRVGILVLRQDWDARADGRAPDEPGVLVRPRSHRDHVRPSNIDPIEHLADGLLAEPIRDRRVAPQRPELPELSSRPAEPQLIGRSRRDRGACAAPLPERRPGLPTAVRIVPPSPGRSTVSRRPSSSSRTRVITGWCGAAPR
jgi:hypothetical protein